MRHALKLIIILLIPYGSWAVSDEDPYRLSTAIQPHFQFLHLDLDPDKDDYRGHTRIEFELSASLDSLNIHGMDFNVESLNISRDDQPLKSDYNFASNGLLTLKKDERWQPGSYSIEIGFNGKLGRQGTGIIKDSRDGFNYIHTLMQEIYARQFFPCLDEPGYKFPFQLQINAPKDYLAVSNTPVEKEDIQNDSRITLFKKTKPIPVYLLAFAVGPYETEPIPGLSVAGRIIVPKGYAGRSEYNKKITAKILNSLESYFGISYPYEKLDFLAAANFNAAAMENPGLVIYWDELLIEPERLSLSKKYFITNTIIHELAHMWFGNLVTMQWWDDTWLNEGFATWLADEIVMQYFPELNPMDEVYNNFNISVRSDIVKSAKPIIREIRGHDNPAEVFDGLTYQKSQVVLRMLEKWIGRSPFQKGLSKYFKQYAWKNSTSGDLFDLLSTATDKPIKKILHDFVMQAGVPLVSARTVGNCLILSQERFKPVESDTSYNTRYYIPLNLKISDGQNIYYKQVTLAKEKQEFVFDDIASIEWFHLKDNVTGYYLMLLPQDIIQKALNSGQLTPTEIQDVFKGLTYGWQAGKVNPVDVLKLAHSLRDTQDKSVVVAIADPLNEIRDALYVAIRPEIYNAYMQQTAGPLLDKLGYEVDISRTLTENTAQSSLLHCINDNPQVKERIKKLARKYFEQGEITQLHQDYLLRLFSDGDSVLYNQVRQKIEESQNSEEKRVLTWAMARFPGEFVKQNLDYALNGEIDDPNWRIFIPLSINWMFKARKYSKGIESPLNILEWFKEHETFYREKVSPNMFETFLPLAVVDRDDINTFNRLFPAGERSKIMQKQLNQKIASITRKEKLIDLYAEETKTYYEKF